MKNIFLLTLIILLLANCSKKAYTTNNDKVESTSLDAYSDNNNLVQSIINSKNDNSKIKLDGKEYNVNEFKRIIDTISGSYSVTVEKYLNKQFINIIRGK